MTLSLWTADGGRRSFDGVESASPSTGDSVSLSQRSPLYGLEKPFLFPQDYCPPEQQGHGGQGRHRWTPTSSSYGYGGGGNSASPLKGSFGTFSTATGGSTKSAARSRGAAPYSRSYRSLPPPGEDATDRDLDDFMDFRARPRRHNAPPAERSRSRRSSSTSSSRRRRRPMRRRRKSSDDATHSDGSLSAATGSFDSETEVTDDSVDSIPKAYQRGDFKNFRTDRLTLALYRGGDSAEYGAASGSGGAAAAAAAAVSAGGGGGNSSSMRYYSALGSPPNTLRDDRRGGGAAYRKSRADSMFSTYSGRNHFSSRFRSSLGEHPSFHSPLHSRLPPRVHKLVYKLRESVFDEYGTVKEGEYEYEFRPFFTAIVLAVNVILFFVAMCLAKWKFLPFKENPMVGPSLEVLDLLGAKDAHQIREGEWWRFFTPMFLHAGIIHLVLNMVVLYRLAWGMEQSFGAHRVAPIYLLSGISATLASAIFLPTVYGVGASGAIYGLIGALYGDLALHYRSIPDKKRYFLWVTLSTFLGLIIGLYPLLDNFAHVGGLICGFFASMLFLAGVEKCENGRVVHPRHNFILASIALGFLLFWFIGGFIVFYRNTTDENWCRGCHVINCVPSPWWQCCHQVQSAQGIVCERQA